MSSAAIAAGRTLVMTATYNEIETLPKLVDEVFQVAPEVDLVVIDDNSPDGTGKWCDARSASDPRLRCIHRAGKLGLGTAMIEGMTVRHPAGLQIRAERGCGFQPSSALHSGDLGRTWNRPAVRMDVMIGSRYVRGGGIQGWPLKRRLMSRAVNFYARWLLWLKVRDTSGGYRCYRVSKLAELDFGKVLSRGYSFQEELLWMLRRHGATDRRERRFCLSTVSWGNRKSIAAKLGRDADYSAVGAAEFDGAVSCILSASGLTLLRRQS